MTDSINSALPERAALDKRINDLMAENARLKRAAGEDRLTIQSLREDLRQLQDTNAKLLEDQLPVPEDLRG